MALAMAIWLQRRRQATPYVLSHFPAPSEPYGAEGSTSAVERASGLRSPLNAAAMPRSALTMPMYERAHPTSSMLSGMVSAYL